MTGSLRELEKRLSQEPDNLPLRVTVAGLLHEAGRDADAVEHYRKVAIAYRTQGRAQQAIAVCRSILELAPHDVAIHALLAELTEPRTPVPPAIAQGTDSTSTGIRPGPMGATSRDVDVEVELSDPGLVLPGNDETTRNPDADDQNDDDETRPPPATGSKPPANAFVGGKPTVPAPAKKTLPQTPSVLAPEGPSTIKGVGKPAIGKPLVTKSAPPTSKSAPPGSLPVIRIPPAKTSSAPPASAVKPVPKPPVVAKPATPTPDPDTGPARRSSFETETPLPRPLPYHLADPTSSQIEKLDDTNDDLIETKPGASKPTGLAAEVDTTGLAQAARRISGLIASSKGAPSNDLAAELETRQRRRLSVEDLEKVASPPPTVPTEQVVLDEDLPTPIPRASWSNVPQIPREPRTETHSAVPQRDTHPDTPDPDRDDDLTNPIELFNASPLSNAFFTSLPQKGRDAALSRCHKRDVRAGTIVIRQGEASHPLFLVITGRLELRGERANGTIATLDVVEMGQYVGEAALLNRTPSALSAVALVDSELFAIPAHALFELAGAYPALWAALKDTAERRTRLYDKLIRVSP